MPAMVAMPRSSMNAEVRASGSSHSQTPVTTSRLWGCVTARRAANPSAKIVPIGSVVACVVRGEWHLSQKSASARQGLAQCGQIMISGNMFGPSLFRRLGFQPDRVFRIIQVGQVGNLSYVGHVIDNTLDCTCTSSSARSVLRLNQCVGRDGGRAPRLEQA